MKLLERKVIILTVGERIKHLRTQLGLSQVAFADKINVSKQTLYKYENNIISNIPSDKIESIASLCNVSPAYLMGWDPDDYPCSDEPPISAKEAFGQHKAELYQIPVVATIAAGKPIYSEEHIIEWIDYAKPCDNGKRFATKIKGNSMFPLIHDGDTIIIDTTIEWNDNDIVVATVNGNEGTCKRIKKYSDGIALISINPQYEPMQFTAQEVNTLPVHIIGRVVESRTKL